MKKNGVLIVTPPKKRVTNMSNIEIMLLVIAIMVLLVVLYQIADKIFVWIVYTPKINEHNLQNKGHRVCGDCEGFGYICAWCNCHMYDCDCFGNNWIVYLYNWIKNKFLPFDSQRWFRECDEETGCAGHGYGILQKEKRHIAPDEEAFCVNCDQVYLGDQFVDNKENCNGCREAGDDW